tara:strand:+ start:367 stop:543 length:177 start_codon:yes stop_codon:yes gene_type:complete
MISSICTGLIIILVAVLLTNVQMKANRRMKQLENTRILKDMIDEVERELERIDNEKKG